jgi:hypothetical protein
MSTESGFPPVRVEPVMCTELSCLVAPPTAARIASGESAARPLAVELGDEAELDPQAPTRTAVTAASQLEAAVRLERTSLSVPG